MFRCQVTNKISKRGEKCNKIVVATRDRIYTEMIWEDDQQVEIEVARGWEIVKEVNASDEGVKLYEQMVQDGTAEQFVRSLK
jgi:hypothetical protein